jgi:hypothetical protein
LGLDGHCTLLLGLLRGALVGTVVAGEAEVSGELVRDVGEVLAGFLRPAVRAAVSEASRGACSGGHAQR